MTESRSKNSIWLRLVIFVAWISLCIVAGVDIYNVAGHGVFLGHFDKIWGAIFITFLVGNLVASGLLAAFLFWPASFQRTVTPLLRFRARLGWLRWIFAIMIVVWPAWLLNYTDYGFDLEPFGIRLYLFVITSFLAGLFLTKEIERVFCWSGWYQSIILFGVFFLFLKVLTPVTDFPLSLTWSEGNRIWDYSVLFGRDLYNYPPDAKLEAYIDRGRQSLWGLPFLLPEVTIEQVRLWSALVFTIPLAVFGWVVFRPSPNQRGAWFMAGLWTLLFLYQGPIYTPLVLAAILVAIARGRPLWFAVPLIFVAGYYAQISRLTWMFAPAIWAGMAALQDYPPTTKGIKWREWGYVLAYGLTGFVGGFGIAGWRRLGSYFERITSNTTTPSESTSQILDVTSGSEAISSNSVSAVITDQALLWERLWPNPTYREGIVIGLALAIGPIVIFLLYLALTKKWNINIWQKLGFLLPILAFLIVGIVISVKIGGGSNLHNLDMLLLGLIFVTSFAWESGGERTLREIIAKPTWVNFVVLLALAIPAFYLVIKAKPLSLPPANKVEEALAKIEKETKLAIESGGEVLFMDQRQLLTFGNVGDIPLVADYEKKLVMDKAMSQDEEYFVDFYRDISNQRFALIVSEPQRLKLANESEDWAAENDIWITWVAEPLLCYYEPGDILEKTKIWLLVPRQETFDCILP